MTWPFGPRADLNRAELIALLELDEVAFERRFGQTALSRPGRAGLLRNAAIVLGNEGDELSVPALSRCSAKPSPSSAAPRRGRWGKSADPCTCGVEKPVGRRG